MAVCEETSSKTTAPVQSLVLYKNLAFKDLFMHKVLDHHHTSTPPYMRHMIHGTLWRAAFFCGAFPPPPFATPPGYELRAGQMGRSGSVLRACLLASGTKTANERVIGVSITIDSCTHICLTLLWGLQAGQLCIGCETRTINRILRHGRI